jgi:hypothetical protein
MTVPVFVALVSAGAFFLTALLSGVVKYVQMMQPPKHLAAPYIDTAHRAALLYSFAMILLAKLLEYNTHPLWLQLVSLCGPLLFFALAVATYLRLGFQNETDNQFREQHPSLRPAMRALIVAEVGGFVILFLGFLEGAWQQVS